MGTWFVTGASRGFGAEIVREALARGHDVVATARRSADVRAAFPDAGDALLAVDLDVTDEAQARAAVAAAEERFGGIDVLVNNAGRGLLGAVEEVSDAEARAVFDTNVLGTLAVLRAALPGMRARRRGRILNVTSIGGFTGTPGWGVYAATKFAVEGFSESLRLELAPLGIDVVVIEPGYFRTDFLDSSSLHRASAEIADYAETAGTMRGRASDVNHAQLGDPVKGARVMVDLGEAAEPPFRIQLGSDAVARATEKRERMDAEAAAWLEVSLSTDHDDAG